MNGEIDPRQLSRANRRAGGFSRRRPVLSVRAARRNQQESLQAMAGGVLLGLILAVLLLGAFFPH